MSSDNKQPQLKWSIRFQFTIGAFVLLILALGFNALLSLNALEKLYVESIASQYSAIGKDLQRKLEQALRLGKSITKFVGMDDMLTETKANILREYAGNQTDGSATTEVSVSVMLPDGSILYSTEATLVGTLLSKDVTSNAGSAGNEKAVSNKPGYLKVKNMYITWLPIHSTEKQAVATVVIMFDEKQVKTLLNTVRDSNITLILIIIGGSLSLLVILLSFVTPAEKGFQQFSKFRIALVILLVIGSAQIVFSGLNTNAFRKYYLEISTRKVKTLMTLLKKDIESWFSKGIRIEKLVKMDVLMGEVVAASPELNELKILNREKIPLYLATQTGVLDFQKATADQIKQAYQETPSIAPEYQLYLDLQKANATEGYLSANLSKDVIYAKLFEIALDSATILIISMLFFVELLILIFQFIEQRIIEQQISGAKETAPKIQYGAIRPAGFLFFFGIDLAITFLPLYMETLYTPIFGLSKDMVMGLPISAKVFFSGIAIIITGMWLDRRGWYEPLFSGLVVVGTGVFYSWLAPNALHFILSRALVGLGYGIALMAFQGFVIAYTDESNKAQGLSQFFAGTYAGSICGAAAGAMLAERIGFRLVFLLGALLVFSVIAYLGFFMRHAIQHQEQVIVQKRKTSFGLGKLLVFFSNRNVLGLILCMSIPAAIAEVGFLDYFSPIYLNRLGVSQSNIGRIFMLHGICLIYLAPLIGKYIDAASSKRKYIVIGSLLGSLAFITFYLASGFVAVAIGILMLGLSASFESSRSAYVLKLKVTQDLGPGQAMGAFSSAYRIGQVLGPLTFGWFMFAGQSLVYFGLAYIVMILFFIVSTQSDRKLASIENR